MLLHDLFSLLKIDIFDSARQKSNSQNKQSNTKGSVMGINQLLKDKRDEILRVAARHGAINIRIFGSVARGEQDEKSDLDLLVTMETGRSLLDHAALWLELRDLLGREVDVVSEKGLQPRMRDRVLKEAVPL